MPVSTPLFKDAIYTHIRFIAGQGRVLDAGAGDGNYGRALQGLNIDGLEIHAPYIEECKLHEVYKQVHNCDILKFNYDEYDYIILGDIVEHLTVTDGVRLVADITAKRIKCLVGVPFMYAQGPSFEWRGKMWNVESEIHHQPDLNPTVMKQRYPSLEVFLTNNVPGPGGYAYYTNYHRWL